MADHFTLTAILSLALGYLLGSIPFGLVLTKIAGLGDIRSIGSGNIGATNVLRTGNKKLALATLLLDGSKGALAVCLCYLWLGDTQICEQNIQDTIWQLHAHASCYSAWELDQERGTLALAVALTAFASIIGHIFPVWLKFKGGKGVATALGILLALKLPLGLAACFIWLLTAVITRYSSVSALMALGISPVLAFVLYSHNDFTLIGLCVAIAALVFYKHRANISRLVKGTEPQIKIGKKKTDGKP